MDHSRTPLVSGLTVAASVAAILVAVSLPSITGRSGPSSVIAAPTAPPDGGSGTGGITVQGVGKVTLTPDEAQLSLGVQTQAASAQEAQSQANGVMAKLIAAMKRLGVADKDLATQWLSLQPQYAYEPNGNVPPRVSGYQANQSLAVTGRDLSKAGAIIDAGVGAGANQVGGISFSLADPTAASNQARAAAMSDAHARAQTLAAAAGLTLGRPISISEVSAPTPVPMDLRAMAAPAAGAPTQVQPGTTQVEVDVTVTYAIGG